MSAQRKIASEASRLAPRAYSYLRFSTPDQMQGDSFRRQTELAAAYAARNGLELDTDLTLQDLGVSAFRSRNAETGALRRFLDAVEQGLVPKGSFLLVESLDRISRDQILAAQGLFLQIVHAGITLVTLLDGRSYSTESLNANPIDLVASLVVLMRAHDESAAKSRRLKAVWENKRRQLSAPANTNIRPITRRCPAWIKPDSANGGQLALVPDRAALVCRIFSMALAGIGQNAIAATFNREGIPPWGDSTRRPAKHWHASYIVKILDNPAVIGTLVPHELEYVGNRKRRKPLKPVPGYYPAVIDQETWRRVRALRDPGKSKPRGRHAAAPVRNILAGLARCPVCDSTMTRVFKGSGPKGGYPYLVCTKAKAKAGCEYRTVRMDHVEVALVSIADCVLTDDVLPRAGGGHALERRRQELLERWGVLSLQIEELVDTLKEQRSLAVRDALARVEQEKRTIENELAGVVSQIEMTHGPLLKSRLMRLSRALNRMAAANGHDALRTVNLALRETLSSVVVRYADGDLLLRWHHGVETAVPLLKEARKHRPRNNRNAEHR